jgi:hypothetical protein
MYKRVFLKEEKIYFALNSTTNHFGASLAGEKRAKPGIIDGLGLWWVEPRRLRERVGGLRGGGIKNILNM